MKISKFIFILLIIIFVIIAAIYYIFANKYNLEKIISELKKNYDVTVLLHQNPKWSFNPEISYNFNAKIDSKNQDLSSENIEFILSQPYNISPINVNIGTKSLYFRGLKIQSFNLNGKYFFLNKIFNIHNLSAKVGEGVVNFQAKINRSKKNEFNLSGDFNNLHLNQIFRQLNVANWKRLELKISSKDLIINGKIINEKNFFKSLNGKIPINGSMYFVTTEEERFGIAFLNLLIEKLPQFNSLSKSLSQIVNNFSGSPALVSGLLNIKNGNIETSNLIVTNEKNKIKIEGLYNMQNNLFDAKLFFLEQEDIIVEAIISGNMEDPNIQIVNAKNLNDQKNINNDIKNVFKEGINNFIEKLLNLEN